MVAVGAVSALADLRAVFTEETQRTALGAVESRPSWRAFTLSIVGAAERSVVTVTGVDAVWTPLTRRTRLGAVAADPAGVALAGAVDGVTRAVVGAAAAPGAVFTEATAGTNLVAQRPLEPGQAVALSRDVVARPITVDALRTRLTAAVAEVSRRADPLTRGSSEPWSALTGSVVWRTRCSVLTVTGDRAVWPPAALGTHTVTVDTGPSGQTSAVTGGVMTSVSVAAVTPLSTVQAVRPVLTVQLTALAPPPCSAGTLTVQGVTGAAVQAQTGEVTAQTPGTAGTVDGAVHAVPAWFTGAGSVHR